MNRELIISILEGYESQLANAEIERDTQKINWLNEQINEAKKALATEATGY